MRKILTALIILLLIFTSCSLGNEPGAEPSPESAERPETPEELLSLTEGEYPAVDGSTATIPLGEAAAAVLMGIDRSDAARFAGFNGTANAFRNIVNGNADILIVYEPAEETKVELDGLRGLKMEPIGYDGLVFIVNASNPVDSLTVEQVREIYTGGITNWSEVGGADALVEPFQRNPTAGSHALMVSLLMGDTPLMAPRQDLLYGGMGSLLSAVAEFDTGENSIGYNVFFYVEEMMRNPNVKILEINGVAPNRESIAAGEYPLVNPFFAVIREDEPADSPAWRMFEWLQSDEAQRLIYLEGYAPVVLVE